MSQSILKSVNCEYELEIKDNVTIVKIPESHVDEPLTEEQKENLLKFDEEFACRYTDKDEDYVALVNLGSTAPPLVPSYRPFRNHRRDNRTRGEKRTREDDQRSYSNNKRSHYSYNNQVNYDYNNDYKR